MGLQNSYDICLAQQQNGGLYDLLMFLIYLFIFNYFIQPNYLNRTDLREILKVDRTVAVDDKAEIIFRSFSAATNFGLLYPHS